MSEPHDRNLAAGATVGGFRIERRLGEGGVGAVYAAVSQDGETCVAIKVQRRALVVEALAAHGPIALDVGARRDAKAR